MKCINKTKWLAYLRGELDSENHREVDAHLKTCKKCRNLARDLASVYRELDMLPDAEPGPYFLSRTFEKLMHQERGKRLERILMPVVGSLTAVISIGMGIFLGHQISMRMNGEGTDTGRQAIYSSSSTSPEYQMLLENQFTEDQEN